MRRLSLLTVLLTSAALAPAATAQAPSLVGTFAGTETQDASGANSRVAIRYRFTSATVGQVVGTSRYVSRGHTCRGRLTLRSRQQGGYVLRDRRVSGGRRRCTTGDRIFARFVDDDRLRVRLRLARTGRTFRFTLRRQP